MGHLRELVLSQGFSQEQNKALFEKLIASPLLLSIRDKDWERAASIVSDVFGRPFSREEIVSYAREGK